MDGEATAIDGDDPFAQLRDVFAGRRALLLEDDPALSEHVAERLLRAGFEAVERVDSGEAAIAAAARPYDVLILDRLTAGLDGLETLKRVRAGGGPCADAPALMLTALGGERQKVEGLLGGADDYLSKPIGDEELLARIAAQLRRAARHAAPVGGDLVNGPFRLSFGARTLKFDAAEASRLIDLSPLEFAIVCELMTARGQPVTKTMLWDRCWVEWRFLPDNFVNIIDARISALRRRLKEQAPELGDDLHPLIVSARSQSLIFRDLSAWAG
ncbi:MAG: response regulator transcription factor [Alphaproteobacteria bacterium]|jgi:DNA-binding response OmpR family regulator|nr:response regulator transcription factor [Alphaproteobacteria bacterium]MBU2041439.1 response regulator transcription factor [Alphaproteobacteria bacterium]MBU2126828.1 response regulator transcription factor [Alphaproteobacteria bacterium]MBU2208314.1 response regulator transcription factor [Alphaproteobacteria bacterium]MBU2292299.1 response regulator transcription factor [Alphaproteobacteria bacterium]